jgi:glycosyltransferase involved in cell wall biosynthesis
MKTSHPQQLLLIMRDQYVDASEVLNNYDIYPGERLWGYRPLVALLGKRRVGVHYVKMKSSGILRQIVSSLIIKTMGDMRVLPSLALRLWKEQKSTEAVLIMANNAMFTALVLRLLGLTYRAYPLLLGWPEFKFPEMSYLKRMIWVSLLRSSDAVLCLGINETKELHNVGLSNARFLEFGVDTDFWKPNGSTTKDYVFSVGADPNRDFETFLTATIDFPTVLCARTEKIQHLKLREKVTVVQGSQIDVLGWFQESKLVVIPIKDTIRPSGQNCILQAMASGKAVITTRTRGIWTDKLHDWENCVFVPPSDHKAMRQAIHDLYYNPAQAAAIGKCARETVLKHFTLDHFTRAITKITGML